MKLTKVVPKSVVLFQCFIVRAYLNSNIRRYYMKYSDGKTDIRIFIFINILGKQSAWDQVYILSMYWLHRVNSDSREFFDCWSSRIDLMPHFTEPRIDLKSYRRFSFQPVPHLTWCLSGSGTNKFESDIPLSDFVTV